MKLSIIIPCYNEEQSLNDLLNKCHEIINDEIEIIIVNNGSSDRTYELLKSRITHNSVKVINIEKNIGYGNGILVGLNESKGQIVSWTHADLQTEPKDVLNAYNKYKSLLLKKEVIIKGERKNRSLFDSFFTFLMSIYTFLILRLWLFDINAQPKIFHRSFINNLKNPPIDFSLDLYLLYFFKSRKVKILSYPVFFANRQFGEAKGGGTIKGKWRLIIRTISYIHQLKKTV